MSPEDPQTRRAERDSTPTVLRRALAENRFTTVLVLLIVLLAYFGLTQERFFTTANLQNLLTSVSILWVVSLGLTFVVLSRGFDLSVGSMLALAGFVFAALYNDAGLPGPVALVLTLAAGAALGGGVNGFLIGRLGLPFLVVTLGTLTLFRGVVNLWSDSRAQSVASGVLQALAFGNVAGVPVLILVMIAALLVALYTQRFTYFGRDVYATGGNPEAARISGVRIERTWIAVYAIAGMCAALGGIIQVGRIGSASPLVGEVIIFDATAAVLLGGTSFHGGVGGVGGTAVAVLFIGVLQNGLAIAGISPFWQQIVSGSVLIIAILLDKMNREGLSSMGMRTRWASGKPTREEVVVESTDGPNDDG